MTNREDGGCSMGTFRRRLRYFRDELLALDQASPEAQIGSANDQVIIRGSLKQGHDPRRQPGSPQHADRLGSRQACAHETV